MSVITPAGPLALDDQLFNGGPPLGALHRLGIIRSDRPRVAQRAIITALVAWGPLAALTAVAGTFRTGAPTSFLMDVATHARFLVAVPIFILAEAMCAPHLGAIARHFFDAGLIVGDDRDRFAGLIQSTRRLRDSGLAEIVVIALAYGLVMALVAELPVSAVPLWHRAGDGSERFSPAGWWHLLVSLPVLLILFLGWMWRLFLWARFLRATARLDLQLIPSHPDQNAGLRFVGYSVRAVAPLGFAFGTVVAGRVANTVLHDGASPSDSRFLVAGLVAFVLILFNGPLLLFAGKLMQIWQRGVFQYGALAAAEGRAFEHKWLGPEKRVDESALEAPDFSATTDLYQVVGNVYTMTFVPIDLQSVISLTLATLLPFVPVLLMVVPLDVLLERIAKLLL